MHNSDLFIRGKIPFPAEPAQFYMDIGQRPSLPFHVNWGRHTAQKPDEILVGLSFLHQFSPFMARRVPLAGLFCLMPAPISFTPIPQGDSHDFSNQATRP